MKTNEAPWDRIIRVVLGIVLLWAGFAAMGGVGGTIVGIIGLVLVATGLVGFCPLYSVLKINTNKQSS